MSYSILHHLNTSPSHSQPPHPLPPAPPPPDRFSSRPITAPPRFDTAHATWSRIKAGAPRLLKPLPSLPPPLHEANRKQSSSRCYGFKAQGDANAQALHPVTWCSSEKTAHHAAKGSGEGCRRAQEHLCPAIILNSGPKGTSAFDAFLAQPPKYWFYCRFALTRGVRKISPGVLALAPGATLLATVDVGMIDGAASESVIKLEYLVSYERMGIARLHCSGGCSCEPQTIDAHQLGEVRNVSIFTQYAFRVQAGGRAANGKRASRDCELALRVLAQTSSGGHKFKVRSLSITAASQA